MPITRLRADLQLQSGSVTSATIKDQTILTEDLAPTSVAAALQLATTGSPVNISLASPPAAGQALVASDATHAVWSTVATASGVSGQVPYFNGSSSLTANANMTFDGSRLSVDNVTTSSIDFSGYIRELTPGVASLFMQSTGSDYGTLQNDGANTWSLGHKVAPGGIGTPVLSWTAGGKVGIGNTAPGYALDVSGDVNVTGGFFVNGVAFVGTPSSGASGSIQFSNGAGAFSSDAANLFWDNTNKALGIGIGAPTSPLDVAGYAYLHAGVTVYDPVQADGSIVRINDGNIDGVAIEQYQAENGALPVLGFWASEGTAASPLPLQQGDHLGFIGFKGHDGAVNSFLVTPSKAQLNVFATTNFAVNNWGTAFTFVTTTPGTSGNTGRFARMVINDDGHIAMGQWGAGGWPGNVAPNAKLEIYPDPAGQAFVGHGNSRLSISTAATDLFLALDNPQATWLLVNDNAGNFLITENDGFNFAACLVIEKLAPQDSLRVKANGNVGLGTSSPDEKLHVAGNIKMVDGSQAANKVMASDAAGKGSWQILETLFSDLLLDENGDIITDPDTSSLVYA